MSAPTDAGAREVAAPAPSTGLAAGRPGAGGSAAGPRVGGLAVRLLAAAAGGVAVGLSFQPAGLWPLLLLGVPALTLAVRGARPRRAFGIGFVFGLAMLAVAVSWLHVLGLWVAALAIAFEALFLGVLGIALALVGRLRGWPVAAACCWAGVEWAYATVPFGGFGWTRLGYAVVDTPLAGWFPLVGVVGVSFAVALTGQLVAALLLLARHTPGRSSSRYRRAVPAVLGVAALVGGGAALRGFQVEPLQTADGSVAVGIVQGNIPGRGIEAMGRARSVTNNHLAETVDLTARARLGEVPTPDFLLWPENSTDIDPTLDGQTRRTVDAALAVAGVPILVGAVMQGPGPDERQTSALWWDTDGEILARYDKRNLVPFGEWIPFRAQLLPLVPILREVGAQSVPGTQPGVLEVRVGDRTIRLGDVICFELAYDDTVYATVTGGAQVSLVQSNNATYGGTGQVAQQFAITRARAMETRREIAVATTNSLSGLVDRNGRVVQRSAEFTAAGMVVSLPLRSAVTPAVLIAPWLQRALGVAALICCVVAVLAGRRPRSRDAAPPGEDARHANPPGEDARHANPPGEDARHADPPGEDARHANPPGEDARHNDPDKQKETVR